ncbi:hypothetical protein IR083_01080 [Dysgonomonas sp. GY75]|uniref:hypothetical protein n=1 Tax=Dysgonomonas sp. GY75 TaxID=2780419 RepID=UPI00188404DA|nr:hypothetical protein [Dysgonomonas sp. GY75]MBF0647409.1 hypothetical protein [Dysgonomonas sp. GY75]
MALSHNPAVGQGGCPPKELPCYPIAGRPCNPVTSRLYHTILRFFHRCTILPGNPQTVTPGNSPIALQCPCQSFRLPGRFIIPPARRRFVQPFAKMNDFF